MNKADADTTAPVRGHGVAGTGKTAIVAVLSAVLAGCADFTGMPSPDLDLPAMFQQRPPAPTEPPLSAAAPAKLDRDWWDHADDPVLRAIVRRIYDQNLSLAQARSRLRAARLARQDGAYRPSLGVGLKAQYDRLLQGDSIVGTGSGATADGETGTTAGYYDANRPDIRKAEAAVIAAAGELELSKSEMYPRLVLSGNLSLLGNLTGAPLDGRTVQVTGLPSLSLPLFDWGKRLSAARIKDERLSETASAYRETVVRAMNEVEEFWSAYRLARAEERATAENARIARQARHQAVRRFQHGISDGVAAETAAVESARAEIAQLRAQAESVVRLTALTKALGGATPAGTAPFADD